MNKLFTEQLIKCECCPRLCRVNRMDGQTGFCKLGKDIYVSHIGLHYGEEPPISGTRGSGTIFFSSCNLACVFCQNYQISQEHKYAQTKVFSRDELAMEMINLQDKGAHNINFVSPSHLIFQMADAITVAKERGLVIPVLYNSNGYDSVDALRQIRGLVDIYLPDIKYMVNITGKLYSNVKDYADIVPEVLKEMLNQVGHLMLDEDGIAIRGLLVRHLVLPGFHDNSRKCLHTMATISTDTHISIMSQYSPQYKAVNYPELNRTVTKDEYDDLLEYALDLGLENVFIQEIESQKHYIPDFREEHPFKD